MANFFTVGKYRSHHRKDHRFEVPRLNIVLAGKHFETYDWSLGGFRIADFKGRPPVGSVLQVSEFSYPPTHKCKVSCKATVTRVILGKNQIAFSFQELDDAAFNFLEAASLQRLSILSSSL